MAVAETEALQRLADKMIHLLDKLVLGVELGDFEAARALEMVEGYERILRNLPWAEQGLLKAVWPIIESSKKELHHLSDSCV